MLGRRGALSTGLGLAICSAVVAGGASGFDLDPEDPTAAPRFVSFRQGDPAPSAFPGFELSPTGALGRGPRIVGSYLAFDATAFDFSGFPLPISVEAIWAQAIDPLSPLEELEVAVEYGSFAAPGVPGADLGITADGVRLSPRTPFSYGVRGKATGDSTDSGNDDGMWFAPPDGPLELVAREGVGAPAPGSPPDVPAGARYLGQLGASNPLVAAPPLVDDVLGPAFNANLDPSFGGVGIDNSAVFGPDESGQLVLRHRRGDPLPATDLGGPGGNTFISFELIDLKSNGDLLMRGNSRLYVSHADGTLSIPSGARPEDLPVGVEPGSQTGFSTVFLEESGRLIYAYSDDFDDAIVMTDESGQAVLVAREGDSAPNYVAGARFTSMVPANSLNAGDGGYLAFYAQLEIDGFGPVGNSLWRADPELELDVIAVVDDPVVVENAEDLPEQTPGAPRAQWEFMELGLGTFNRPQLDNSGGVFFSAEFWEGLQSTITRGLFFSSADGRTWLVAFQGQTLTIDGEATVMQNLQLEAPAYPERTVGDDGLVFGGFLAPDAVSTPDFAVVYLPEAGAAKTGIVMLASIAACRAGRRRA